MVRILDKINNTDLNVPFLEFAIHPLNGEITNINRMNKKHIELGKILTGIIFEEDGTTIVLYGKKEQWKIKIIWYCT